jgi:hypothetical protein
MDFQALRRWWPLAAVAALLALAALAAAHSTPQLDRIPRAGATATATAEPPQLDQPEREVPDQHGAQTEQAIQVPEWIPNLLIAVFVCLVIAAGLVLIAGLVSSLRRRRESIAADTEPGERRPADSQVLAAVDAGLADLSDTDRDPRRAVIACWLRLEEAAEAAGMPRRIDDTSTDLVIRLLDRVASAEVLADFAAVYRAARYATAPVDERMRERALAALHRVRADLASQVISS